MILFIAITSTLNLCIGYVLGVYFGQLPGLGMLPRREGVDPPEAAIDLSSSRLTAVTPPAADFAPQPPASAPVAPAPPPSNPAPPESAAKKPSPAEVMNGLAAFQEQLEKAGEELKAAADDEAAFGKGAEKLQEANHAYLEKAQTTIDELGADPADQAAADCRGVLQENTKRVSETSGEIDAMLADGTPDQATREKLIATTDALGEAVAAASAEIGAKQGLAPQPSPAAPTNTSANSAAPVLASIDALQSAIESALSEEGPPVLVAALRRDPLDIPEGADVADLEARLLASITELAGETLGDAHVMAQPTGDQVVMLFKGDTVEQAAQRIEQVRQQVEKTNFALGGATFHATLTCALAEAIENVTHDQLMEHVAEAIEESERHGVNRSYHHDGRFPAPVMPGEVEVKERTVTLDDTP